MITPDEAVKTMDALIESLPQPLYCSSENFGFLVSKEVAQALYHYARIVGFTENKIFVSGDEFRWKGFKCKVV